MSFSLGLSLSLSGITSLNALSLTLIAARVSSSGFLPAAIAACSASSSALIASYSAAAKDSDIASYASLYSSSGTILSRSSTPSTTSTSSSSKAPYGGGLYKCRRSLFALTISILSRDCRSFSSILVLLNSHSHSSNISGIARILRANQASSG